MNTILNEPHSTKQVEDCIGWALETTPETIRLGTVAASIRTPSIRIRTRSSRPERRFTCW